MEWECWIAAFGVCDARENHPARLLFDSGVTLTVNSDDYALCGTGVSS